MAAPSPLPARVPEAAYDERDDKRRPPRRFTRLQYKLEHVGWTGDRRQHLFTVRADGSGEPVQLTAGDYDDSFPVWSPDGATLAFVSARQPDWDTQLVTDIYLVDAGGGDEPGQAPPAREPRRLTQGGGTVGPVSWSPDGTRLATLRYPAELDDPRHTQIATIAARSGEMRLLTTALDRNCGTYPPLREPLWDGDDLIFIVEDHGNTHIWRVDAGGARAPELVVGGERHVSGFDLAGERLVYAADEIARVAELFVGERRLTGVGDDFRRDRELVTAERFSATSADGTPVEAWAMKPAAAAEGQNYPTLLTIHGGPFGQYGNQFLDELQVYCGGGYAVVFCNPRGSSGYSEAWGRAIRGPSGPARRVRSGDPAGDAAAAAPGPGWGTVDYEDCLAVIDEAVRRFDFVDGERLGVIGGSYGGYLTSWIVGHTDRFKAAVSERAVNQLVSIWGSSDIGWDFKGYLGTFLFEDAGTYLAVSPATYAENIHTPLLILHSENDLRCPMEQAEQLFATLRLLKRPVELVRFPAESHELSRSGSPVHRVQRFEVILEWFDRYLKD